MATGSVSPFQPVSVLTIAASTTSAAGSITPADSVLVYNASAGVAFVVIGAVGQTPVATALNGVAVPPGARQLFYGGPNAGSVAVILATGTTAANVYVASGNGTVY